SNMLSLLATLDGFVVAVGFDLILQLGIFVCGVYLFPLLSLIILHILKMFKGFPGFLAKDFSVSLILLLIRGSILDHFLCCQGLWIVGHILSIPFSIIGGCRDEFILSGYRIPRSSLQAIHNSIIQVNDCGGSAKWMHRIAILPRLHILCI